MKKTFLFFFALMCSLTSFADDLLTKDMYHEWDASGAGASIVTESPYCEYHINESAAAAGTAYGNGNVPCKAYADLSAYDQLELTFTEGTPRLLFNRLASDSSSDYFEIKTATSEYLTVAEEGHWVIDLKAIANARDGFVHLNVIKDANYGNVTITEAKLIKVPVEVNLIEGDSYDFEGGTVGSWIGWGNNYQGIEVKTPGYDSEYCMYLKPKVKDATAWTAQACFQFDETLDPEKEYTLHFWAKGSGKLQMFYQNASGGNQLYKSWFEFTEDWQEYTETITPNADTQRVLFSFATADEVYIDNVSFTTLEDPEYKLKEVGSVDVPAIQFDYLGQNGEIGGTTGTVELTEVAALIDCTLDKAVLMCYDLKGDSVIEDMSQFGDDAWFSALGAPVEEGAESTHFVQFSTSGAYAVGTKIDVMEEGAEYKAAWLIANPSTGAYYRVNFTLNDIERPVIEFTKAGEESVVYQDVSFLMDAEQGYVRTLDLTAGLEAIGCTAEEALVYTYFAATKKHVADPLVRYNGAFDVDGLSTSKDAKKYTHVVKLDATTGKVTFGFNQEYNFSSVTTLPATYALVNPTTGATYYYNFKIGAQKVKGEIPLTSGMFFTWDDAGKDAEIEGLFPDFVYCINEKAEPVAHAYGDPNFHSTNFAQLDEYATLHLFFNAGSPVLYFNREADDASYLKITKDGYQILDANGKVNKVKSELLIQEDLEDPYIKEAGEGHWVVSLASISKHLGGFAHLHAIEGYKDAEVNDPYISKGFVKIYKAVLTPGLADLPEKETRKHSAATDEAQEAAFAAFDEFADEDAYDAVVEAVEAATKSADFYAPYVKAINSLDAKGKEVWNSEDNAEFKAQYDEGTVDEVHPADFTEAVKAAQVAQTTAGSTLYFWGSKKATDWKSDQTKAGTTQVLKPANLYLETPVVNPYLPTDPGNCEIKQFANVKGQTQPFTADTYSLYQVIEGLVPNAEYKVQFYAMPIANSEFNAAAAGEDIAQIFANDQAADVEVVASTTQQTPVLQEITAWADQDGTFVYGLKNVAEGGNWYIAQYVDLTLVAMHSDFPDGDYFLYDTAYDEEADAWFGGANSWGTQASLIKHGIPVTLYSVGHNICTINTHTYNNANSHFLGTNGFIDSSETPWTFTNNGDGTWSLSCEAGDLTEGTEGTAGKFLKTLAVVQDGAEPIRWKLVSYADRVAELEGTTKFAPKDATFVIKAADFSRNHFNKNFEAVWNVTAQNCNLSGGANENTCAESWRSSNGFVVSQTITGLPNGFYKLNAQATVCDYDQTFNDLPVVFANDGESQFCVSSKTLTQENGENSMSGCSASFNKGLYQVEPVWAEVTDGTLTVGVKTTRTSVWAVWDNFELEYYGENATLAKDDPLYEIVASGKVEIAADKAGEIKSEKLYKANLENALGGEVQGYYAISANEGLTFNPFQWSTFTGVYNLQGEVVNLYSKDAYVFVDYDNIQEDAVTVKTLDAPEGIEFIHTYFIAVNNDNAKAVLVDVQITFGAQNGSDATSIDTVKTATEAAEAYDLTGRKVSSMTKGGIYIVGGKKVLVK